MARWLIDTSAAARIGDAAVHEILWKRIARGEIGCPNAALPVIARPTMRVFISRVPS